MEKESGFRWKTHVLYVHEFPVRVIMWRAYICVGTLYTAWTSVTVYTNVFCNQHQYWWKETVTKVCCHHIWWRELWNFSKINRGSLLVLYPVGCFFFPLEQVSSYCGNSHDLQSSMWKHGAFLTWESRQYQSAFIDFVCIENTTDLDPTDHILAGLCSQYYFRNSCMIWWW